MQTIEQEVNHPNHYNSHESGIEPIIICRHLPNDLGNVWKYNTRYEDKGTPEKDLKKLIFYFNDYRENFIDFNNNVSNEFKVPYEILDLMEQVIEAEPVEAVKQIFRQVYLIAVHQGIISPAALDEALANIKTYAESF